MVKLYKKNTMFILKSKNCINFIAHKTKIQLDKSKINLNKMSNILGQIRINIEKLQGNMNSILNISTLTKFLLYVI